MRIQNQEPIWEERCHNFPQLQERLYQIHRQMIPNIEKKDVGGHCTERLSGNERTLFMIQGSFRYVQKWRNKESLIRL